VQPPADSTSSCRRRYGKLDKIEGLEMESPSAGWAETSDAFNAFLASYPPQIQKLALDLRALVLSVLPSAIEQVDPPSKIIAYGIDRTYAGLVCAIAPYRTHVNLMFARGAELPDPEHLLEGTGKRARHVRITARAEVENPALRTLLEVAAHTVLRC
jgi:hypothetical protein